MTPGEQKFALQVEMVLNRIPQPEYRQLMVEAMMVLILVEQHDNGKTHWNEVISVDRLVHTANDIFLEEQVSGQMNKNKLINLCRFLILLIRHNTLSVDSQKQNFG